LDRKPGLANRLVALSSVVVKSWWWRYPTLSVGWGRGETLRRPNSPATPQSLDQWSKMEVVLKMACRRVSGARHSERRWIRSCRGCPLRNSSILSYKGKRRLRPCQRSRDSS